MAASPSPVDDAAVDDASDRQRRRWPRRLGALALAVIVLATSYVLYQRWYVRQQIDKIPRIETPTSLFDEPTTSAQSEPIAAETLPDAAFAVPVTAASPGPVTTTVEGGTVSTTVGSTSGSGPGATVAGAPATNAPSGASKAPTTNPDDIPDVTVAAAAVATAPQVNHRSVSAVGGPGTQNILIIGTDSRTNVSASQATTFGKGQVFGARSDTIVILRIDRANNKAWTLSIPRDTWVHIAGTNSYNRINAAFGRGAPTLVRTIQENFDIPITHFAIVDFDGFQRIVDSIGGVKVCFPKAIRDTVTGLAQPVGCQVLNPTQAVAFVRSRHAELQQANGSWVPDPRGDLGRIQRQQAFIRGVISQGLSKGVLDPTALSDFLPKLKTDVALDDQFSYDEIKGLGNDFRSFDPNALVTDVIPTKPRRVGDKDVLVVDAANAAIHIGPFGHR